MTNRREFLLASGTLAALGPALFAAEPVRRKIRLGQIGTTHGHATKLEVYRESADYEVVGLVEPDEQRRAVAVKKGAFRDLPFLTQEQLLALPELDAVLIETDIKDLLPAAEACILAGKHVHLDKPAGTSFAQFARVLSLAAERHLLVQMGYMFRYNPGVLLLKQFLTEGWLGDIFEVNGVISKVVASEDRKRFAEYPGGMMFELGCHLIDLVIGLFGKPTHVTPYVRHSGNHDDALNDNMLAVLEYPRNVATIRSSALEVEGFSRRHLVVCGTEGTFEIRPIDDPQAIIALSKPRGSLKKGVQTVPLPKYRRYVGDAAEMAVIIRGEEEAAKVMRQHDLDVQATVLQACGLPV